MSFWIKCLGFVCLGVFVSCEKPPDYSVVPHIEFRSITHTVISGGTGIAGTDRIVVTLYFEDGDGDLGIDAKTAAKPAYANGTYGDSTFIEETKTITPNDTTISGGGGMTVVLGDTVVTPAHYQYDHVNYYYDEYVLRDGTYKRIEIDNLKGGLFAPLSSSGRLNPIDGTLEFTIDYNQGAISQSQAFLSGELQINDSIRYEIHLLDRGFHESNVVVTDPVQILKVDQP